MAESTSWSTRKPVVAGVAVLALLLPAAALADDPPTSTAAPPQTVPTPTPTPTAPAPDPAPKPEPAPTKKKTTAPAKTTVRTTPRVTQPVHTPVVTQTRRSTPTYVAPTRVQPVAPTVKKAPVRHAVHKAKRVKPTAKPVVGNVRGATHTVKRPRLVPIAPASAVAAASDHAGGAPWALAFLLAGLIAVAGCVPGSLLPYPYSLTWSRRQGSVAVVGFSLLLVVAIAYLLP